MGPYRKLWFILIAVVAITFALFGSLLQPPRWTR
jgi:LPS O-antigen subunit length determinant protein (WzzB/FepE family)